MRIADCGLRIVDCGFAEARTGDWEFCWAENPFSALRRRESLPACGGMDSPRSACEKGFSHERQRLGRGSWILLLTFCLFDFLTFRPRPRPIYSGSLIFAYPWPCGAKSSSKAGWWTDDSPKYCCPAPVVLEDPGGARKKGAWQFFGFGIDLKRPDPTIPPHKDRLDRRGLVRGGQAGSCREACRT